MIMIYVHIKFSFSLIKAQFFRVEKWKVFDVGEEHSHGEESNSALNDTAELEQIVADTHAFLVDRGVLVDDLDELDLDE